MNRQLLTIGENLDRLCSLEIRAPREDNGIIHQLYSAAREHFGMPLTMHAAETLTSKLSPGDVVLVLTGAGGHVYLPKGETDGPLGGVAIARALTLALGVVPVIVTEGYALEMQEATCVAGGLGIRDLDGARKVPGTCVVVDFPADDTASAAAAETMETYRPKAIIATEKLSPNRKGVAHNATGKPASPVRARVEHLMDLAAQMGIATVGIGDNGNEIGFGVIEDAVRKYKVWGDRCQCPCGGGTAARIATDSLIVAGVSNWGAYCLEGAIAAIAGNPDAVHSVAEEAAMLSECVRMGGADGSTGRQTLIVDGTVASVQTSIVDLVRNIVGVGLAAPHKRPW